MIFTHSEHYCCYYYFHFLFTWRIFQRSLQPRLGFVRPHMGLPMKFNMSKRYQDRDKRHKNRLETVMGRCLTVHGSLSAVTHAPFHASVLRPASQAGPMHSPQGWGNLVNNALCECTGMLRYDPLESTRGPRLCAGMIE